VFKRYKWAVAILTERAALTVSHATYVKIYMASTLMQCLTRSLKLPPSRGVVARSTVLPEDIFLEIATYLSIPDLFNLSLTVSHRAEPVEWLDSHSN